MLLQHDNINNNLLLILLLCFFEATIKLKKMFKGPKEKFKNTSKAIYYYIIIVYGS